MACAQNLPKRRQQHPWLSKRALQLRGQQPQPRSRRAASVPRPEPEGCGSLPSASAHPGTAAEPLGVHKGPYPGPGVSDQLSSAFNARLEESAKEMLDSDKWPRDSKLPVLAQSAAHQQHPGQGLYDKALQAQREHVIGSHFEAASTLGHQDEQGGSVCDRHLKERFDVNLRDQEVQKQSAFAETCAAASGRLGTGSILGGAVSAEPLLAQLEDMEARMKAMMSTIESRLYGTQGA